MRHIFLLLFTLLASACGNDKSNEDSGSTSSGEDSGSSASLIDGILNEFLTSNDTVNTDGEGEFDDWLELTNPTQTPLDLSGYGLTDGLSNDEELWLIPNGTVITPGNFLLIWCDKDEDQGNFHASFKLAAAGETISLVDPQGHLVDEVVVPPVPVDTAWARAMNGQWREAPPTPESPNP